MERHRHIIIWSNRLKACLDYKDSISILLGNRYVLCFTIGNNTSSRTTKSSDLLVYIYDVKKERVGFSKLFTSHESVFDQVFFSFMKKNDFQVVIANRKGTNFHKVDVSLRDGGACFDVVVSPNLFGSGSKAHGLKGIVRAITVNEYENDKLFVLTTQGVFVYTQTSKKFLLRVAGQFSVMKVMRDANLLILGTASALEYYNFAIVRDISKEILKKPLHVTILANNGAPKQQSNQMVENTGNTTSNMKIGKPTHILPLISNDQRHPSSLCLLTVTSSTFFPFVSASSPPIDALRSTFGTLSQESGTRSLNSVIARLHPKEKLKSTTLQDLQIKANNDLECSKSKSELEDSKSNKIPKIPSQEEARMDSGIIGIPSLIKGNAKNLNNGGSSAGLLPTDSILNKL
eukprot:g2671.t1